MKKIYKIGLLLVFLVLFTSCQGDLYEVKKLDDKDSQSSANGEVDISVTPSPEEKEALEKDQDQAKEEEIQEEETAKPSFAKTFTNDTPYDLEVDPMALSNEELSWSFRRNPDHTPVLAYTDVDIHKYGAYYLGNTEEKVVYLTFDEGYEYGFTPTILDTLKDQEVQAAFFVTQYFIEKNPDLIQRMVDEGHIVGNHSDSHPAFPSLTSEETIEEVKVPAESFEELTGEKMDPFFRFPQGKYSVRRLYEVRKLGFRSIFWSMAYADWDVDNQPGKEVAYDHVMTNVHPGSIILLHAVSESNTLALEDILTDLKAEGYRFGSLYELE